MEKINCSFIRLEELKKWDQKKNTSLILVPAMLATTNYDMLMNVLGDLPLSAKSKIVIDAKYAFSKCKPEILNMCWHLFDNYLLYKVHYECTIGDYGKLCIPFNFDNKINSLRTVINYDNSITEDINVNLVEMNCNKYEIYIVCSFLEMLRCLSDNIAIIKENKKQEEDRNEVLNLFGER